MYTRDELEVISTEIVDSIQPLLKWIPLKHALQRDEDIDSLRASFPWVDIMSDEEDDSDEEEDDSDEEEDPDEEEVGKEDDEVEDDDEEVEDDDPDEEYDELEMPRFDADSSFIPKEALDLLEKVMGLEPHQVVTIMNLISCAENGTPNWEEFYNYIEYGDDAEMRGFTTTIFGACSGTGSLQKIFKYLSEIDPKHPLVRKYGNELTRDRKEGDIKGIEGFAHDKKGDPTKAKPRWNNWKPHTANHMKHILGDFATLDWKKDAAFRLAVWKAFVELNWVSVEMFCQKASTGFDTRPGAVLESPLAKGFLVDTSLNHGDARYWQTAGTWKAVFDAMKNPECPNEIEWLTDFMAARKKVLKSGAFHLDWSMSGSRVDLWYDLIDNPALDRPILLGESGASPPVWQSALLV